MQFFKKQAVVRSMPKAIISALVGSFSAYKCRSAGQSKSRLAVKH